MTVEDLMVLKNKIPFISQNKNLNDAIKLITQKKLGVLIATDNKGFTTGILTDGNIRKLRYEKKDLKKVFIKKVMTKKPISVSSNTLAVKALRIMNEKKITSLCVHKKNNRSRTIGIVHVHTILDANIQ